MWIEIQRINILTTADCKINERQFPINVIIKLNKIPENTWMDERKTSKKKTMLEKNLRETHSCLGTEIYMHVTPTSSILYIYIFSFLHQKADPSNYPKVYTCTLKSVLSVYILTMNIPSLLCIVILSETVHVIQTPIVVSLQ